MSSMQVNWDLPTRVAAILVLRGVSSGSYVEMGIRKIGLTTLELTKDEIKKYEFVVTPTYNMRWNAVEGAKKVKYELSDGTYDLLKNRLEEFDKNKGIHLDLMPLAEYIFESAIQDDKKTIEKRPTGG